MLLFKPEHFHISREVALAQLFQKVHSHLRTEIDNQQIVGPIVRCKIAYQDFYDLCDDLYLYMSFLWIHVDPPEINLGSLFIGKARL